MGTRKYLAAALACLTLAGCARGGSDATSTSSTTTVTSAAVEPARVVALPEVRVMAGPSDEELLRSASLAIASDPELSRAARNVEIDVTEGIVTLRGATTEPRWKRGLEEAVAAVPGVVTTLNKLQLRPSTDEECDETLAWNLQRALLTDPAVGREAELVTIDVRQGFVTLRGAASTLETRAAVVRTVSTTPGVADVANRLRARSAPARGTGADL